MKIKVKDIVPGPFQAREAVEVEELSQSIKEHGLLVPIKVRPKGDKYELIFGYRRVAALKAAGVEEVDAIVADVTDEEARVEALIENVQRENLEPIELAKALQDLKDSTGWSNREVERRLGWGHPRVRQILSVLEIAKDLQPLLGRGEGGITEPDKPLTIGHVARVRGSPPEIRDAVLRKAAKEGLTRAQTRELAEAMEMAETVEVRRKILETTITTRKEEITLRAKREVLLDQFAQVRERLPTLDERLFRRMKPLGKAVDEIGLLAADRVFWDALNDQHRRAVLGYLGLALDKLRRVYDDLERRVLGGEETRPEQFRLPGPERDSG